MVDFCQQIINLQFIKVKSFDQQLYKLIKEIRTMLKPSPKYRISYKDCYKKQHSSQKANMICLNNQCIQNALICSFCLEDQHKGHNTKPLKHFLENLQKKYSQSNTKNIDNELQQLQEARFRLLASIKEAVETLARSFQELEQEIMKKYEQIKHQIIQKESQRNRFHNFYEQMVTQGKGDPNFQIQNYLNFQPLIFFNQDNGIDALIMQTQKSIQEAKKNLVIQKKKSYQFVNQKSNVQILDKILGLSLGDFIIPLSIKRNKNTFSQQSIVSNETVGYMSTLLNNWTGKLLVKVINLDAAATLTIGICKKADIEDSKHIYPLKNNEKTYFINSKGIFLNSATNYISSIKTGDVLEVLIKKNNCKIKSNKNICRFQLTEKQKSVFFFSMQGLCEIQIIYPYKKNE